MGNMENPSARRKNRWSPAIWGIAVLLLLLPAVAMRYTGEVDWAATDFVVMAAMLAIACGAFEFVARRSGNTLYRAAAGIAIVTAFATVWVNLAVGMLGPEGNPDNLLFGGVLAVAVLGALIARFRAKGMAYAMVATALAHAGMTLYALVGGYAEVVFHVGLFIIPWLLSAQLFWKAARELPVAGNAT